MAESQLSGFDLALDFGWQTEESEKICDGSTVFTGALRHLLLGELEFAAQAVVGAGLFHGIEVGALEIFDDGDLHRLLVGYLAEDRRDGSFAGDFRCQPASFAGDELEASIRQRSHKDRLHDSSGGDRSGELGE